MSGKGTCDCAAKTNCYHILAVKLFCGHKAEFVHQPINLTNLMKHKNLGKLTGSKKKGHVANSIEKPLISQIVKSSSKYKHHDYIKELVHDYEKLNEDNLIEEIYITTNVNDLSDEFIRPSFELDILKPYFDSDAWESVKAIYAIKLDLSTCKRCNQICLEHSIGCTGCLKWIHFACDKVSAYHRKGTSKNFKCSFCKFN